MIVVVAPVAIQDKGPIYSIGFEVRAFLPFAVPGSNLTPVVAVQAVVPDTVKQINVGLVVSVF